ncbi:MAG: ATP-dependent Clp protease proteolytic subunit [Gammaproteobacteria bacterium]
MNVAANVSEIEPAALDPLERVYLLFQSEVNQQSCERLCTAMGALAAQGFREIYLMLSTPGGGVSNGLAIYNFMRGLPCRFVTHNIGNVDSIGNVIFLGGDQRYACAQATFMWHGVGFNNVQVPRLEQKNLKEMLDNIKHDHRRIGEIVAERSNLQPRQIGKLFLEAQTKDANFAIKYRLAHAIRELQIESGRQIISLTG